VPSFSWLVAFSLQFNLTHGLWTRHVVFTWRIVTSHYATWLVWSWLGWLQLITKLWNIQLLRP
jgi:hypothetical protein